MTDKEERMLRLKPPHPGAKEGCIIWYDENGRSFTPGLYTKFKVSDLIPSPKHTAKEYDAKVRELADAIKAFEKENKRIRGEYSLEIVSLQARIKELEQVEPDPKDETEGGDVPEPEDDDV